MGLGAWGWGFSYELSFRKLINPKLKVMHAEHPYANLF